MRCEEIRETFHGTEQPPDHVSHCQDCRDEWEMHVALRAFKAPDLDERFNARVLAELDYRDVFTKSEPGVFQRVYEKLLQVLPPVAMAACLLLLLWMGRVASHRPKPELRALESDKAKVWSQLPDAVPPAELRDRRQLRLVKGDRQ